VDHLEAILLDLPGGEAPQGLLEGDPRLQAGERRPETGVDAESGREVLDGKEK